MCTRQPLTMSLTFVCAVAINVLSLAGAPTSAFAMAHYRVWYFDNVNDVFEEGDLSDGNTKLIPPAWACGMRFDDPSYYRWVDGTGGTMSSANFSKDVHVWIPRPGCPESDPLIEYKDGSASFPHPDGASYMEISTDYAIHWIDENGEIPSCGDACASMTDFTYDDPYEPDVILSTFATLKTALLTPRQQVLVPDAIAVLEGRVRALQSSLLKRISERRRTSLGDREATVRSLEDGAWRRLADALQKVSACQQAARKYAFGGAFVACDLSASGVDAAGSLLTTAEHVFREVPSRTPTVQ